MRRTWVLYLGDGQEKTVRGRPRPWGFEAIDKATLMTRVYPWSEIELAVRHWSRSPLRRKVAPGER